MSTTYLDKIYQTNSIKPVKDLYRDWAPTYESELKRNGYITPKRCANLLKKYKPENDCNILDFGCGTGLVGEELALVGYKQIYGCDLSEEMVELASAKRIYKELSCKCIQDFLFQDLRFGAIVAAGVISPDHAEPDTLRTAFHLLSEGGNMVFSLNDYALKDDYFLQKISEELSRIDFMIIEEEYGPHITGLDLNANILVLKKVLGN